MLFRGGGRGRRELKEIKNDRAFGAGDRKESWRPLMMRETLRGAGWCGEERARRAGKASEG